jgi:hypothetical protein
LRTLHFTQDALRPRQEGLSCRCQANATATPIKELHPKPLLEAPDLLRKSRLGDEQLLGGEPEMQPPG